MHQLAAPLRRLSNAYSFNKCLLIQLVGKIASCPLIYRALTTSHLSGCPRRANRSIWLNHVQWEQTMGGPVEISGDQLRSIVERIEHIEEEIKELNEGKREIFQEAKSNGFDVKVIREIVRLRKQDQKEREERESLLEVYLRAIKGARVSKAA
jgi:uncharacterized protein (UPF0335 family)